AIMFEALFILTAVDAGTRVARFMLQDSIGNFVPKFKEHSWRLGAWVTTAVMVAAWGAVLMMGVTDPLGGINTLLPLFGISNQLLAAIALSVCMAIAAKRGSFKYLWIIVVPLSFAAVVTITASFQKIFSTTPAVGYFANNAAFSKALADGKTAFGSAKTQAAMEAVVRNTMIQGILSIVFVVLSIIVIIAAILATIKAFRDHSAGMPMVDNEDRPRASRVFAPSGLIPTPAERELMAEWDELPADQRLEKAGHH
ncbi:MAG: carbon starvation CstA 5TM domain-containing protein, partial [Arthrobacter oryzae]